LALTILATIDNNHIQSSTIGLNNIVGSQLASLTRDEKVALLAHEIGHAIGLGHSDDAAALMYYQSIPTRFRLGYDDWDGMTYLYPKRTHKNCSFLTTREGDDQEDATPFSTLFFIVSLSLGFLLGHLGPRQLCNSSKGNHSYES
jgi:hypothetical protein